MEEVITKIGKSLNGKIIVKVQDDLIDCRVHLRTKDNRWVFVRKGVVLRPVLIDAVLGVLKDAWEEFCGKADDIKKRR